MFGLRQTKVLPVDQLAPVREDLRKELLAADEHERPGLAAALRIVEGYSPAELRRRWVAGILEAAPVDPRTDTVRAIKALRDAVPLLSLSDAVALVQEVAAQPEDSGTRRR
jgi:hypothetical protein